MSELLCAAQVPTIDVLRPRLCSSARPGRADRRRRGAQCVPSAASCLCSLGAGKMRRGQPNGVIAQPWHKTLAPPARHTHTHPPTLPHTHSHTHTHTPPTHIHTLTHYTATPGPGGWPPAEPRTHLPGWRACAAPPLCRTKRCSTEWGMGGGAEGVRLGGRGQREKG